MSKLMELVDSYAKSLMCEHLEWSAEHDATRAALNAAVQELERDAARYRAERESAKEADDATTA